MTQEGYSFTVITGGHRNDLLENLINSIVRMKIPNYEILVCGNYFKRPEILYNHQPKLASEAEVCKMRNLNCENSKYDKIIILDDDVEFTPAWFENIKEYLEFDMTGCKGVEPDGNRWFDYNRVSRKYPNSEPELIPYNEYYDDIYISGYFMMFKRYVWEKVKFDNSRKNYQHDDVDFCHRVTDAGYKITVFPDSTVIHYVDNRGREVSEQAREEFIIKNTSPEERYFLQGIQMFRSMNWIEAIDFFKKSIAINNGIKENYHLGLSYKNIGKLDNAKEILLKVANSVDSKSSDNGFIFCSLHFHLAEIFEQTGDFGKAINEYKKTLDLLPSHKKAKQAIERLIDK